MSFTSEEIAELRTIAVTIAQQAGELIRSKRPESVQVAATKSSPVDVVTEMDQASEDFIREQLAKLRPQDGILGEEGSVSFGSSGLTWIVDPIDGTVNYLYGISGYAVSIAVSAAGSEPGSWDVLAGAVHDVKNGHTWHAGKGLGAKKDDLPLQTSTKDQLATSLVGTGFGYDAEVRRQQAKVLVEVLPRVRDIRRLGAAAVDLCLVAEGRLDAYFERGLKPWDLAAGYLVVQEAGGKISGLFGEGASEKMVVAGGAGVQGLLVELLEANFQQ